MVRDCLAMNRFSPREIDDAGQSIGKSIEQVSFKQSLKEVKQHV